MNYKTLSFSLPVSYPFRLDWTVWALRRRKANIVDWWDGKQYRRVAIIEGSPVKITVSHDENCTNFKPEINITLKSEKEITGKVQKEATQLLQKMLGLNIDLQPFYTLAGTNDFLKPLARQFYGVKPPRFPDVFEGLINSITGQVVTLDLSILLQNRLSENYGMKFIDDDDIILHAFPRPDDLVDISVKDIKKLGFSYQKAEAIKKLAADVFYNKINLADLDKLKNSEVIGYLSGIRGIGRWSAEYALLRSLGRLDIFPGDDIGAKNNIAQIFSLDKKPDYEETRNLTSQWHPYEGFVYFHLLLNKLQQRGVI